MFLNADSGGGGVSGAKIVELFAAHACACEITPLKEGPDWQTLAQQDRPQVAWIAAGGDGTVNAVAAACAGTRRPMGVLPVGTLNHFARDLGIPLNLSEAVQLAATGTPRPVDVAEGNGLIFVNNSSLGMYPAMVLDRDRMHKGGGPKWWAMVRASAKAFIRFRCLEVEFEVNGNPRRCRSALLFVGNNRYQMEGGSIGQRERLDEGVLSVALIAGTNRWGMLKVFAGALVGRVKQVGEFEQFTVASFKVNAYGHRRLRVSFDGEVKRMPGPIQYRLKPGALHVIAPEAVAS